MALARIREHGLEGPAHGGVLGPGDALHHATTRTLSRNAACLYDLANCYEKLGKNLEAAAAYERYAQAVKGRDPAGAERARQRAADL